MPKKMINLDLHGMSLQQAELYVLRYIKNCHARENLTIRIITGRGNHPNADGGRGIIYKKLPKWLENEEIRSCVTEVKAEQGAYRVTINGTARIFPNRKTTSVNYVHFYTATALMKIIVGKEIVANKIEQLKQLVKKNRKTLLETDGKGNTALMVAAATNQVEIISFLLQLESDYFIISSLLRKTNHEGVNALMVAVGRGHVETVHFLLKKSASLLKVRDYSNTSVFQYALKADNAEEMLNCLSGYLLHHKREKGYTGLFPEYKNARLEIQAHKKTDGGINVVRPTPGAKKKNLAWFFKDRVQNFFHHLKAAQGKLYFTDKVISPLVRSSTAFKRILVKKLFESHTVLRKAFLRFNNEEKPRII